VIKKRRVAIVGTGVICPLGHTPEELWASLLANRSGVQSLDSWKNPQLGLSSSLAAPVLGFDGSDIPRKFRRSMSRVAMLSHKATEQALLTSGLSSEELASSRTGVFYGSCMGGLDGIQDYYTRMAANDGNLVKSSDATTFLRIMPHTCASHIAVGFGIGGRVNASSTACAAGTQAIGFGYEAIKYGLLDRAICGGAEELSPAVAAIFDVLSATDANANAELAPKPFDRNRSGIVVGEGAGTVVLEDMDSAIAKGSLILGEIVGFFSNNDASHLTNPCPEGLAHAMRGALKDWGDDKRPSDIDYINAHAAGTTQGDRAEAIAVSQVFGSAVPISSMKGHHGHLMGGTGSVEFIASLWMLKNQTLIPTLNHQDDDPEFGPLHYLKGNARAAKVETFMKNSFAFGGVNACLIVSKTN